MPAFPGKETLSLEGGGPRFGRAGAGEKCLEGESICI